MIPKETKILIIDDNKDFVDMLQKRLMNEGFDVEVLHNAVNAIKVVEEAKPDLLIIDVLMPGIFGSTLCKNLKSKDEFHKIPIIMVSGQFSENEKPTPRDSADAYLAKPFPPEKLIETIESLIG